MNIELKKKYAIHCDDTAIRHEASIDGWFFSERISRKQWTGEGEYDTKEEAEKKVKELVENYKATYPYQDKFWDIEKDTDNNVVKITIYRALARNFFSGNSNREYKRKTKPYFTVYRHYSVVETLHGYGDDENAWKNDAYADPYREFEWPSNI